MTSFSSIGLAVLAATFLVGNAPSANALTNCSYQGIQLFGEVAVVPANAHIKVEIVATGGDLKVHWVNRHANICGEWRRVGLGADFTVQIVPSGGDIKIQEVPGSPGLL